MQRRKPVEIQSRWRIPEPPQSLITAAAMVGTAVLPLYLLTSLLPRELVLPTLCVIAIFAAALVSLYAWQRGQARDAKRVTAWDLAGALAFVACAAAILGDPRHLSTLL